MKLGLHVHDLKSHEGRSLIKFNDSITLPCGALDLLVSFGEGKSIEDCKR